MTLRYVPLPFTPYVSDTAANLAAQNPLLPSSKIGLETDTMQVKVGNSNTSTWNQVPYWPGSAIAGVTLFLWAVGEAADFTAADPVLPANWLGEEWDTGRWKVGDGVTAWNALGYLDVDPV
jgi:hypothetical protein